MLTNASALRIGETVHRRCDGAELRILAWDHAPGDGRLLVVCALPEGGIGDFGLHLLAR